MGGILSPPRPAGVPANRTHRMGLGKPGWTQRTFTRPGGAELGCARPLACFISWAKRPLPVFLSGQIPIYAPAWGPGRALISLEPKPLFQCPGQPFLPMGVNYPQDSREGTEGPSSDQETLFSSCCARARVTWRPVAPGKRHHLSARKALVHLEVIVQTTRGKSTSWNVTSLGYYLHHFWVKVKGTLLEKLKLNFVCSKTWKGTTKVQNLLASIWFHFRLLFLWKCTQHIYLYINLLGDEW